MFELSLVTRLLSTTPDFQWEWTLPLESSCRGTAP